MKTVEITLEQCGDGDIVAADMFNKSGVKLLSANTMINSYIKQRLLDMEIETVLVYDPPVRQSEKKFQYKKAVENYKSSIIKVKNVITEIASGRKLNYEHLMDLADAVLENTRLNDGVVLNCINDLKSADEYTYTHSMNVGMYSMLCAKWLNLPKPEINRSLIAGILHDIGKTMIPQSLLNKKSKLTNWEFDYIKNHPIYGYRILEESGFLDVEVKQAVIYHHERLNGSGYPFGIYPDKLFARIVAVADVYDAITSDRAYKKGKSPFNAFKVFKTEGPGMYDANISNLFLSHISSNLIGAEVKLKNGEKGRILYVSPQNITQPIISVDSSIINITDIDNLRVCNKY